MTIQRSLRRGKNITLSSSGQFRPDYKIKKLTQVFDREANSEL